MILPANLNETTLAELIQLVEIQERSGRLQIIRTDINERASIFFQKGQVVHASTEHNQGDSALTELFSWDKGKILFSEAAAAPPRLINKTNTELIVAGLNEATKTHEYMQGLPPMDIILRLNTSSLAGEGHEKLMLDASEWNFLILVDGKRTLKQIFNECELPTSQAAELIGRMLEKKVVVPIK